MTLIVDYVRRVEKISTIAGQRPTVAPSLDHTDGTWSVTDIYTGELFINLPDGEIWSRDNNRIIQLNVGDKFVSGMGITNGSSGVTFTVAGGVYVSKSEFLVHPTTADEITITDGDPTDPRLDLFVVDEGNNAIAIAGTPAPSPQLPVASFGQTVIGAVLVPPTHTGASPDLPPIERDITNLSHNDEMSFVNASQAIKVWTTITHYQVNQYVNETNNLYKCAITHNSGTFSTDLSTGHWVVVSGGGGGGGSITTKNLFYGLLTNWAVGSNPEFVDWGGTLIPTLQSNSALPVPFDITITRLSLKYLHTTAVNVDGTFEYEVSIGKMVSNADPSEDANYVNLIGGNNVLTLSSATVNGGYFFLEATGLSIALTAGEILMVRGELIAGANLSSNNEEVMCAIEYEKTYSGGGGGGTLDIGNSPIINGNVGAVLFEGAGNVLQENNADLFWREASSQLGIGTSAISLNGAKLHIQGDDVSAGTETILLENSLGAELLKVENDGQIYLSALPQNRIRSSTNGGMRIIGSQGNLPATPAFGFFAFNGIDDGAGGNGWYRPATSNTQCWSTASVERMRLASGGGFGINTGATIGAGFAVQGQFSTLGTVNSQFRNSTSQIILNVDNGREVHMFNKVGIGTSTPDASATLDITSTTGGVLFPRMTTAQRDLINAGSPASGVMLYNTNNREYEVTDGGGDWSALTYQNAEATINWNGQDLVSGMGWDTRAGTTFVINITYALTDVRIMDLAQIKAGYWYKMIITNTVGATLEPNPVLHGTNVLFMNGLVPALPTGAGQIGVFDVFGADVGGIVKTCIARGLIFS